MSDQPIPRDEPHDPPPPYHNPDEDDDWEPEDEPDIARHRDYGDEDPIVLRLGGWPTPDAFWP